MDERRRASRKQEKGASQRLGAQLHAGSGSGTKKHDMHNDGDLIECKTVLQGNKQITIKLEDLKSLKYQAAVADKRPVLHVEIEKQRWVLIPEADYVGDDL